MARLSRSDWDWWYKWIAAVRADPRYAALFDGPQATAPFKDSPGLAPLYAQAYYSSFNPASKTGQALQTNIEKTIPNVFRTAFWQAARAPGYQALKARQAEEDAKARAIEAAAVNVASIGADIIAPGSGTAIRGAYNAIRGGEYEAALEELGIEAPEDAAAIANVVDTVNRGDYRAAAQQAGDITGIGDDIEAQAAGLLPDEYVTVGETVYETYQTAPTFTEPISAPGGVVLGGNTAGGGGQTPVAAYDPVTECEQLDNVPIVRTQTPPTGALIGGQYSPRRSEDNPANAPIFMGWGGP